MVHKWSTYIELVIQWLRQRTLVLSVMWNLSKTCDNSFMSVTECILRHKTNWQTYNLHVNCHRLKFSPGCSVPSIIVQVLITSITQYHVGCILVWDYMGIMTHKLSLIIQNLNSNNVQGDFIFVKIAWQAKLQWTIKETIQCKQLELVHILEQYILEHSNRTFLNTFYSIDSKIDPKWPSRASLPGGVYLAAI